MHNQELDPPAEIAHLRRLLDIQPACLMRLGVDGTVLAANDAALMLMGAPSGAQALAKDFAAWLPPDQRDRWRAFTIGVAQGAPASIECDITTPSGDRHPTLFHGVPVTDHPDGVASVAVAARAVAGQRQLEAAMVGLEEQLREREAERLEAKALLAEAVAEADAAEANVARALADVRQLELALEAFGARQKQMADERAAERQRERDARAQIDALQARLDEVSAACRERDAELNRMESAHGALAAAFAAATAERDRLVSALREHAGHLEALAEGFPSAGAGSEEGRA